MGQEFSGSGTNDRTALNPNCNYSELDIHGSVNLALANATFDMSVMSMTASNAFIRPDSVYDEKVPTIRQGKRL